MATRVLKFEGWHLDLIAVQPMQKAELAKVTPMLRLEIERQDSWTLEFEGRLLVCGGAIPLVSGCRALVWCYMAEVGAADFWKVHRAVRAKIDEFATKYPRLEMEVVKGFEAGRRWAKALGFREEPMGGSHELYVRLR